MSVVTSPASASLGLRPPPGARRPPLFDEGWVDENNIRQPFLSYVRARRGVNWSENLEELHAESSRTHFFDVWTRRAVIARLGRLPATPTVIDIGCSTGHLLEDLHNRLAPETVLFGVDLIASGLRKAHATVPAARLLQADACVLPLADACVDAAVSVNLLEHVPDDEHALEEVARILRPGASAVIVVPVGPGNYDYYDRFLGHERRYARGELARKARRVGLRVVEDVHLGAPLYPAFWAVKHGNRRRYDYLRGPALERKVASDIERTNDSSLGLLACRFEDALLRSGVRLPFGIRGLSVLMRSGGGA